MSAPICHSPNRSGKDLIEKKRTPMPGPPPSFQRCSPFACGVLDRVVVDDLIADLAPVVVVQVGPVRVW